MGRFTELLVTIAFVSLLSVGQQSLAADHPLTGSYTERNDHSIHLSVDATGYVETNLAAQYGQYTLHHSFPHRLKLEAGQYKTRGYMQARWELEGQHWDCEYPVYFIAEVAGENDPIDVTIQSPANLYVPITVGSCPHGVLTDWLLSFQKDRG